jgi:hypothetical protein
MNKNEPEELNTSLKQFTGTSQWYKHGLVPSLLYTDGVRYFAEHAGGGAYWFLDIVATEIFPLQKDEAFILIELNVTGSAAEIVCTDGDDVELYRRSIEFTDCPEGRWEFYLTDNVFLLPSEY